jgi:hypothetical protein
MLNEVSVLYWYNLGMDINALATIKGNVITNMLYSSLLEELKKIGMFDVEVKKTSLHIVHKRAFLGVHPRKDGLLLNIVTSEPIRSERLRKTERVSANRYHNELVIGSTEDIDSELLGWVNSAYGLTVV